MLNRLLVALGLREPAPLPRSVTTADMADAVEQARNAKATRINEQIAHLDELMARRRAEKSKASRPAAPRASAGPTAVSRDSVSSMGPLHPLHPLNTMTYAEDNTCRTPSDYSHSTSSSHTYGSCDSGSSYDSGSSSGDSGSSSSGD